MRRPPVPTSTLLDALPVKTVHGALPPTVTGVTYDSRKVVPGDLFVAVPGLKQDGRRYVHDAVGRGASAVVLEGPDPLPAALAAQIVVPSAREALARLADAYYGHPSRALTLVGITGTNGKTTTTFLVDALLRAAGHRTGLIGTIEYRIGDEAMAAGQTTPEAVELQALLARMRDEDVTGVAMEVSSHALALARADGTEFDVAVFTNLTQDHLDFHGTLTEYRRAKRRLFELLASGAKPRRSAVINADDPAGPSMVAGLDLPILTFGMGPTAAIRPRQATSGAEGIRMEVETPAGPVTIASPLSGEHNAMNLLGAVGVALALGIAPELAGRALSVVATVPGRFERVEAGQSFLVVVDYAHTPDALERVLTTARKLLPGGGRLGVVFGCGGDRDRGKRPLMGGIAARLCDGVWVTSDNPRSEAPEAIIAEIVTGIPAAGPGAARHVTIPDRKAAIRDALGWARAGDGVVIAGKGHETYQIVGAQVLPFDDRAVARAILAERTA
ncbi:MAG: UDP-N-acetylmuramoyl-L-alanyl-D-glutamate--2,6-diaminopimelate ligase [Candidatus Rokubacteria bacterium RIFCSPLOWO2_12_FULL_71_19]|nr:MAG: UDP-N-acetylmuramoyl-L-alanyl-D-glutamate--2,6-diaminopimelate ligase [Candidatus Rokubacteria bacterium RIFCSPLOWO2_12_FULL_71_19]